MSTRSSRLRRWSIILGAAFALYTIVGFLVLPPILRAQIEKRAGEALNRTVIVERVRMNPLTFSVAIHGLRIVDHDGADLASWREVYVNFDPLVSLAKLEWHLSEYRVVEPFKRLVMDENGVLNVGDLITRYAQPATPGKPAGKLPTVAIRRMSVERWSLDFSDRSRRSPFQTVIGPMSFTLEDFTTRPDASSPYVFQGTTDTGETFSWSGKVSVAPLGSEGHLEFTGFSIPKHMPFAEHLVEAAEVKSGRFAFKGNYRLVLSGEPVMQMENATIEIADLSVGEREIPDPLVKLGRLQVDITRADGVQRTAEVAKVAVDGLEVYVTREAGGTIDLLRLLPVAPAADKAAAGDPVGEPVADAGPAASATVALIEMTNSRVTVIDRTHTRTARVVLDQIALTATNAGTDLDREIGLEMSARWNESGTLAANGTVRALPLAAKLQVKGGGIDLTALDPLLEPFADVRIQSGDIWFGGTVEASMAPGGALELAWSGDAGLDGLAVAESRTMDELVAWKSLALMGTAFQLAPLSIAATEIALVGPVADIVLAEDGTINLLAVLRKQPSAAEQPATPPPPGGAPVPPAGKASERLAAATRQKLSFPARIDLIRVTGARVHVADRSFKPGFSTELRDFSGSIRGLSSENLARADVDLSGSLDGVAPLRISGQINPLAEDVYSDVTVLFSNIDLPAFSPYSGRFIGQKIQKGKLRIDLAYKLSQRELIGENRIVFDQFYLGEKVESPEALKLPVGLALAVMRERDGTIPLDVPVRGNLDDPEFKYGRVVWRALGNIFIKAATSPFKLLGGMFGGAELDLSYADFPSGSAATGEDAQKKLAVLTKALFERPALRLEISAPPAPATDRDGLVAAKFARMLREEKHRLATLAAPADAAAPAAAPGSTPVPAEVAPDEINALVASLFVITFPEEAEAGSAAAAAAGVEPVVAPEAPQEETRPGLVRRTWRRVFGGEGKRQDEASPVPDAPAVPGEESGTAPALTLEMMRDRLLATVEIADEDYAALARARAVTVRDALVGEGKIEPERVFLLETTAVPEGATGSTEGGRVFFNLQ